MARREAVAAEEGADAAGDTIRASYSAFSAGVAACRFPQSPHGEPCDEPVFQLLETAAPP